MVDNLTIILGEFEKLKGQFVITDSWNIERLVSIGDDGEDWYYITFDGRDLKWNSCVGRVIPLKGHLIDSDYENLVRIAKLNHYDQTDDKTVFLESIDKYISKYSTDHKFLTEFCWDLI